MHEMLHLCVGKSIKLLAGMMLLYIYVLYGCNLHLHMSGVIPKTAHIEFKDHLYQFPHCSCASQGTIKHGKPRVRESHITQHIVLAPAVSMRP